MEAEGVAVPLQASRARGRDVLQSTYDPAKDEKLRGLVRTSEERIKNIDTRTLAALLLSRQRVTLRTCRRLGPKMS